MRCPGERAGRVEGFPFCSFRLVSGFPTVLSLRLLGYIYETGSGSVRASLNELFGKPELLSEKEGNGWRPERGADKVDALKGSLLRVQGLPPILQLHLMRFKYDWQTDTMSKINHRYKFPQVRCACFTCEHELGFLSFKTSSLVVVHRFQLPLLSNHTHNFLSTGAQSFKSMYRYKERGSPGINL